MENPKRERGGVYTSELRRLLDDKVAGEGMTTITTPSSPRGVAFPRRVQALLRLRAVTMGTLPMSLVCL